MTPSPASTLTEPEARRRRDEAWHAWIYAKRQGRPVPEVMSLMRSCAYWWAAWEAARLTAPVAGSAP